MPKIVHFEMEAKDTARAMKFYKDVFGWEFQKMEGMEYFMTHTAPADQQGIGGALMPTQEGQAPRTINWIDVPNMDEYLTIVADNGGKVLSEKQLVPNVGYTVLCEDTEGVVIGLIEFVQQG